MIEKYKKNIESLQKTIKENNIMYTWIGCIKLGIVCFIIFTIYRWITTTKSYLYIFLLSILCYIIFSIWQSSIKKKIKVAQNAVIIYQKHIDRITGEWIHFDVIGEEYIDNNHAYASDLDIIGKTSLFQLLNITNTYHGRKQFVKDLLSPTYSTPEILKRQTAIIELSNKLEFVNMIEQKAMDIGVGERILKIINVLNDKNNFVISKTMQKIIYILPLIATISFIVGMYVRILPAVVIGFGLLIMQVFAWIVFLPKLRSKLQTIRRIPFSLKEYTTIFNYTMNQDFSSETLQEIQTVLGKNELSSSLAMKDLNAIINMISVDNNFLIYGILNIFMLWDFRCYIRFNRWQNRYGDVCTSWFEALGNLESLMCFSIMPMVCNHTCMPQIVETKNTIRVSQLGHPLIDQQKRVNNDFTLQNNICIISGSNMSGKTTFMRTVGINLLLAKTGGYVCAKTMQTSIFNLVTSMRIADDLNEGVSTFYAELQNIKNILDIAKKDTSTFFMIDEIFRGTNSVDRLEGAIMVVTKLHQLGISGLITTHDLELCAIEKQYNHIKNYHFLEDYKNNKIVFSYKIQDGVSTTTNARQLMRMLGII